MRNTGTFGYKTIAEMWLFWNKNKNVGWKVFVSSNQNTVKVPEVSEPKNKKNYLPTKFYDQIILTKTFGYF